MAAMEPMIDAGFFKGGKELAQMLIDTGKTMNEQERKLVEIDGHKFFWNGRDFEELVVPTPDDEPYAEPLTFFTLDGLVEYIKEDCENMLPKEEKLILQVVDWKTVKLLSQPSTNWKKRHVIAQCQEHTPEITFGRYMTVDMFNTMLLSVFIQTESLETLFQVIKSMTKEQTLNTTDDGVTQQINVKSGISTASTVNFKNPVPLAPMRTFTEVEQPESNFVMRINEDAQAALFEADGGAWKNEAVARIKAYLKENIPSYNHVVILA